MKVIKVVALVVAGLFLFLSLSLLGLDFTMMDTALSPQFMITEVGKLNTTGIIKEEVENQIPPEDQPYLSGIDETLTEIKPWINQQINIVINGTYEYLLGKTDKIDITIDVNPIKQTLVNSLTSIYLQAPPADYTQLPAAEKDQYLTNLQQQFMNAIPSSIVINQDSLGTDNMRSLEQAREIFGYIRTAYIGLIALSLVLILLIFLIFREIKRVTRSLGIIFLIDGVVSTIAFFILKQLTPSMIPPNNLPSQVQTWMPQVISDVFSPWGIFSLAALGFGIILLVTSFFAGNNRSVSSGESV